MMSGLPLALAAALVLAGCSRRHDRPPAPVPTPVVSPTPTPAPSPSPDASPAPTPAPSAAWTGEVYATANLTGPVVATRTDPAPLRVAFPSASSFPQGVTARPFSIRWRGTWQIPEGTHRFTVRVDDGVRLLIDGVRVFESWQQQPPTTYTVDLTFTETALHAVVVEYHDVFGSGVLEVAWAPVTPGPAPTPGPSPGASPVATPIPTPPAGPIPAATKVVAPNGNDATSCQPATPCKTVSRAAQVAVAGDVVVIRPGTYAGHVRVAGAGTAARPIIFLAETPGSVVLTGTFKPANWSSEHGRPSQHPGHGYVHLRDLIFDGVSGSLTKDRQDFTIGAVEGWRFTRITIRRSAGGINVRGHGVTIEDSLFEDIAHHWLAAAGGYRSGGSGAVEYLKGLVIRGNTARRIHEGCSQSIPHSAVSKILFSDGLLMAGNTFENNRGPAAWLDWNNINAEIRDNVFARSRGCKFWWEGPGLWIEGNVNEPSALAGGSADAKIRIFHNRFEGNSGPGLGILESAGVEAFENTFKGNSHGFSFRILPRAGQAFRRLRNLYLHDNVIEGWTNAAVESSIGNWDGWNPKAFNVVIFPNRYLPGTATLYRWLGTSATTMAQVHALGFEVPRTVQP